MNRAGYLLLLLIGVSGLAPSALAQPTSDWWAPVAPRDRYDDRYDRDADRYERRGEAHRRRGRAKRGGPPFCRNGAGHPVHGRAWCVEKGFIPAPRYRRPRYRPQYEAPRRWRRHEGTSVRFRISYERIRRWGDVLTHAELDVVLDRRIQRRLYDHRRHLGTRAPLEGRWVPARGATSGRVLQLRAGRMPIAELVDWNGDRRVDATWLYEGIR